MAKLTPLKAIRQKCLECSCGSFNEVKLCPITDCALYDFRLGKNPNRAGIGGNPVLQKHPNSTNDLITE